MVASTCVIPLQIVSAVELVDACPSGFPLDLIRLRVNGITASLSLFKLVMAENLLRRAIIIFRGSLPENAGFQSSGQALILALESVDSQLMLLGWNLRGDTWS